MSAKLIDQIQFDLMWASVPQLKQQVDVWKVLGLPGYGVQVVGSGDSEFQMRTKAFFYGGSASQNNSAADAHIDACEDLQGEIVTVVDVFGEEFQNVLIRHVDVSDPNCKLVIIDHNDTAAICVEIMWQALVATEPN